MYAQIAKKKTPAGTKLIHSGTAMKMEEIREDLQEEGIDDDESQSRQEEPTRRPRLTSRKAIGRRSPRIGTLTAQKKTRFQSKALIARYEDLAREEFKDFETKMEFSPGPIQAKPTKMMQMMKKEVDRRVEIELQLRRRNQSQSSIAKKIFEEGNSETFVSPEDDKEVEGKYRQRMEMMMDADEARREDQNRSERQSQSQSQKQKKAWYDKKKTIKALQERLQEEEMKNQELQKKWMEK